MKKLSGGILLVSLLLTGCGGVVWVRYPPPNYEDEGSFQERKVIFSGSYYDTIDFLSTIEARLRQDGATRIYGYPYSNLERVYNYETQIRVYYDMFNRTIVETRTYSTVSYASYTQQWFVPSVSWWSRSWGNFTSGGGYYTLDGWTVRNGKLERVYERRGR